MSDPSAMVQCTERGCSALNPASAQFCSRCGAELKHEDIELFTEGFKGTPDEIEAQWYEKCYKGRGDTMLQLTWRAVLMGSVLGAVLSVTNIYIGLKAGWGFGVAITACILSYAIWTTFYKLGFAKTPMTILENNCMQSTASSAGYSTGGTLISAFAAYMMLNNETISYPMMIGWIFFLAIMGVTMAIPMKRQMINIEQLRFPSGIAAAETLRALHSHGDRGMRSAKALGIAGVLAAISQFWKEGFGLLGATVGKFSADGIFHSLNVAALGPAWVGRTVSLQWDPVFLSAGAISGIRVCTSMLLGSVLCWMVFVPIGLNAGVITLSVSETLPLLPAAVATSLKDDPNLGKKVVDYIPYSRALKWTSVMTPEQRDQLKSHSTDPYFLYAVDRLYVRSQFRASAPLKAVPAGVTLPDGLEFISPEVGLRATDPFSVQDYRDWRKRSADPAWTSAIDSLWARSRLPNFEPLWAAAPLEKLPEKLKSAGPIVKPFYQYDEKDKRLMWRGDLSEAQRQALAAMSADAAWQTAIAALPAAVAARSAPAIPESLAGIVEYDAAHHGLVTYGPLSESDQKLLLAGAAVASSAASREAAATQSQPASAPANPALAASITALDEGWKGGRASENYRDLVQWTLWAGTSCMVTSSLLVFALQWKSILRAFSGLGAMFGGKRAQSEVSKLETPASWFIGGQLIGLIGLAILGHMAFQMPYWETAIAVALSFFLALVASRVTGETDTTPVGAMGKITQLSFAAISPGDMKVNLMSANVTAAAASSSADLLTDLKSGYLLGAHPTKQFIAQFAGIFAGTLATVTCFRVLIPDASVLGGDEFPAPAAQVWKGVAEALANLGDLHPLKIWSLAIGGVVGIILPLLAMAFPRHQKYMPSAAGIGLSWSFQFYYALSFFLGGLIGWVLERSAKKQSDEYLFPVASGIIAGGSLMGVVIVFIENGPSMLARILGG